MHLFPRDSEPSSQVGGILDSIHFQLRQESVEAVASQALLVWESRFCLFDGLLHLVSCKSWFHFLYTTTLTLSGDSSFCSSSSMMSFARSPLNPPDPAPINGKAMDWKP